MSIGLQSMQKYIEMFYNRKCRHGDLNQMSLMAIEALKTGTTGVSRLTGNYQRAETLVEALKSQVNKTI